MQTHISEMDKNTGIIESALRSVRESLRRFIFPNQNLYSSFGIQNQRQPSENKQRTHYKGMFFRAINIRAQKFAEGMLDATVVRRVEQGEFEEVEPDHPWVELKNNPSPHVNPFDYWMWMSLSIDLVGHARSVIRNRRSIAGAMQPTGFLPIYQMFGELDPIPTADGGVEAWNFWRADGKKTQFPHEEVITFDRYSPFSPYETVSLVQAGILLLDVDHYMKEYRSKSVKEGGLSSVVLSSDEQVQKTQRDQISQDFKAYMGTEGIDKALALSHGFKPVNFGMDARDLQYIEGNLQSKDDIFDFTGVPETLFSKDANRANVEGAERVFAQYTIQPELARYCMQLTTNFERVFDADPNTLFILPPDVSPMDEELEMRKRESQQRTGQRTINEFRAEDGKEPYEHPLADEPLVNMSLLPLSDLRGPTINDQFKDEDNKDPDPDENERAKLLQPKPNGQKAHRPWGI